MKPIFPILTTDRCVIREIKESDAKAIYSYFSLDEVTKFYDLESFTDIQQAHNLINIWSTRFVNNEGIRWAITLKESDICIGTCGFHSLAKMHRRAEIGYELHPQYWGKGLASEVVNAMIQFGFEEWKLHRIEAFIFPEHVASERVLMKNGMQAEGILRDYFFEKGRFVNAKILSIITSKY